MRRHFFTCCSVVSLVMCVGVCALWVRSCFFREIVSFGRAGGNCQLAQSLLGNVHLLSNLDGGCSGGTSYSADRLADNALWNGGMSGYPGVVNRRLGFVWQTYTQSHWHFGGAITLPSTTTRHRLIVIPYWSIATAFAVMPILYLRRRRWQRPEVDRGVCPSCGYDLRATPDRCPECGARPATAAARYSQASGVVSGAYSGSDRA